ncbi:MAG: CDP-glycerol glycerophosphotransferase family protein, partial [Eubacterium sp.]|nr:CDP-glycerol glycerophosphotransferase family protein [Eubacterium sp.]
MVIEKFIRNLKTKGLKETLRKTKKRLSSMIFRKRARIRELEKQVETQKKLNEMFGDFILFKEMKANGADDEAIEEVRSRILANENGAVRRALKELYVKKIIPEIYADESRKPVTDTVIFMESGTSPSPSSFHIAKEIEKQGKYEVKYIGLKIRKVPEIEFYDNACDFIRQAATAKAVFLSTANNLMSQFDIRPETKVIQLWHGVGVFKKVGYSTADNDNFGLSAKDRDEYNQYRNYTYVTLPAE